MALPTLVEYSDSGNTRTYAFTGHSISAPKLLIQKRKVPSVGGTVFETSLKVVYGTTTSDDLPNPSKISMEVVVRSPVDYKAADFNAAMAFFQAIVADDTFDLRMADQLWIA